MRHHSRCWVPNMERANMARSAAWCAIDASRGPGPVASRERAAARASRGLTPVSGMSITIGVHLKVMDGLAGGKWSALVV
jgi:hypothetical protein